MTVEVCPKCKKLPTVQTKKGLLRWTCTMYCHTLGCNLYWPIIETAFSEDRAKQKAADRWNEEVKGLKK